MGRGQVDADHLHRMVAADDGEYPDAAVALDLVARTKMVQHGAERDLKLPDKNQLVSLKRWIPRLLRSTWLAAWANITRILAINKRPRSSPIRISP